MTISKGLTEFGQYALTWLFVLVLKRTRLEGTEDFELADETVTVFKFRADRPEFAQATPFGTIIWNLHQTESLSDNARQFVLTHERSHRDRNPVWKGFLYGGAICVAVAGASVLKLILAVTLGEVPFGALYQPVAVSLLFVAGFLLAFRIEETVADYQALQQIGEKRFTEAYKEVFESGSGGIVSDLVRTILYTHPKQTLKLHRFVKQYN
ncbi:M48 family metalloprotease [Halorubrum sp. HHNYT27]|uniref:M48 family metalloprotease n=1 Tax=Halorubrum sp. HHNYT27 TaxID=3402275 RepID=UPI003EB8A410